MVDAQIIILLCTSLDATMKLYRLKMLILTLDWWLNMSKIFKLFYILVFALIFFFFGMTFKHLVISNFFLGDDIQISRNYQENFFSSVKNVKRRVLICGLLIHIRFTTFQNMLS
jgi:hypothetical protein